MRHIYSTYKEHYKALIFLGLPIVIGQIGVIVLGFADTAIPFQLGRFLAQQFLCLCAVQNPFPDLFPLKNQRHTAVDLDIYVQDNREVAYNIEIQTTNTGDLPKRSRYYQSVLDMQQLNKGERYKNLKLSLIHI